MTLPMENNTTAVVTKLAGRSLRHQKRRNCMVVVAVALAAFLLCFAAALAVFTSSALKEQVDDTWELVYSDVTEENIAALQEVPDFATVGTYYLAGSENDARGGEMTFVYSDAETFWMFRSQMELEEGRLPEAADEIAVSNDFVERYAPRCGHRGHRSTGYRGLPGGLCDQRPAGKCGGERQRDRADLPRDAGRLGGL